MVVQLNKILESTRRGPWRPKTDRSAKVEFMCVGPQRTGSTWLYEQLAHHPEFCFPSNVKETYLFDRWYGTGIEWYMDQFQPTSPRQLKGDVGPTYFDRRDVFQRIADHFPAAKILICIRNPVERAFSVFKHYRNSGLVSDDFSEAIQQKLRILDSGRYGKHSPAWEVHVYGKRCLRRLIRSVTS